MKKLMIICAVVCVMAISGCGWLEGMYDNANYESLTNEKGKIEIFSGGEVLYSFPGAKVKYSSSDTDAVWFTTKDGRDVYAQPGLVIFLD